MEHFLLDITPMIVFSVLIAACVGLLLYMLFDGHMPTLERRSTSAEDFKKKIKKLYYSMSNDDQILYGEMFSIFKELDIKPKKHK